MRTLVWMLGAVAVIGAAGCSKDKPPDIDPKTRAEGLYIHGTTLFLQGKFDESMKAFKKKFKA